MSRNRFNDITCSLARALDQAGDWWTFLIVRDLLRGLESFEQLQSSLGIARNILTLRLNQLCENGLITRTAHPDDRRRKCYRLTRKGLGLAPALVALMQWGDEWISGNGAEPIILRDRRSGTPLRRLSLADTAGHMVAPADIQFSIGPGADQSWLTAADDRAAHPFPAEQDG